MNVDPLQRRALINGGIAGLLTLVVGVAIVSTTGRERPPVATASPSPSPSPTAPACQPTWEIVRSADPGELPNALHDIAMLSAGEGWAVGASGDALSPSAVLIERWDGGTWSLADGPNPGTETNELLSVDASEPNDVWAVGRTASGSGDRPFAIRFDGTQWSEVELPAELTGSLTGVEAVSPTDVWAVGYQGDPSASLERASILHWDGAVWSLVDAGRADGSGRSLLRDVAALAPDDIWAVGYLHRRPLVIRFDGQAWTRLETDVEGLANAIEPVTPDDAWAVGTPIQHFDGDGWVRERGIPRDGELSAVAAISPTDLWAVGHRPAKQDSTRTLVLRYDGTRWTTVDGPTVPGSDALTGVDALADGTVLAVGYKDVQAGRKTLAVRGATCLPEG